MSAIAPHLDIIQRYPNCLVFPWAPFGLRFCIFLFRSFCSCTRIRAPSPYQYSSLTSAFSCLTDHPVTVIEPETVNGKIPSEHKRMTVTHGPHVTFSNKLRFPYPLSFSESISFSYQLISHLYGFVFKSSV